MQVQKISQNYSSGLNNSRPNLNFKRKWGEHISWGANYIKETGKTNFKLFSFPDAKAVFVEITDKTVAGLSNIKERIVQVLGTVGMAGFAVNSVSEKDEKSKIYPMENKGDGIFVANDVDAKIDDKYRYIVVKSNNEIHIVKDPYAKKQENIHGWSSVYNPDNYKWKNQAWLEGKDSRRIIRQPDKQYRGLENLIIDEINIPTITSEGTFLAAKKEIDKIAKRNVATAIEIMPVENTYSRQWGYDGVDKFAVNEKMGTPEELKELIDYAHGKGLNVIMDMVPNHMGPDGNYLAETGPYEDGNGPFGSKLNFEKNNNKYVRDWMVNAALWWVNEFKVDGLRLDMTKETASDFLLKQIVEEVNEHNPNVFLIAEDGRDNKLSVTRYDDNQKTHENKVNAIDMFVEFINNGDMRSTPHAIGFDSEWNFPFVHAIKKAITHNNQTSINDIDNLIKNSQHRVKYAMSHDEIGNYDGTRLIPKIIAQHLDLFSNINGKNDADKGQKAAQLSQKLVEIVATNENIPDADLARIENSYGLTKFIPIEELKNAFLAALAKQRLATGTVMTVPGPKMFFQGDEAADLSHFKFFRELSGDKEYRQNNPNAASEIIAEKGYDTIESAARPDSIVGRIKAQGSFVDIESQMLKFNRDIVKVINSNPALKDGNITQTFKDHGNLVHIHTLEKNDNKIIVFKNYADTLYDGNYSTLGFPDDGKYVEILNSDDKKYGGGGYTNKERTFTNLSQNISFAPNSIIIMKKID